MGRVQLKYNQVYYRGRKVGYVDASGGVLILIETFGPLILKWILAFIESRKGQRPQKIESHVGGCVTSVADPMAKPAKRRRK